MYMYYQDLALNNLQGLICHETQPTSSGVMANVLNYNIVVSEFDLQSCF